MTPEEHAQKQSNANKAEELKKDPTKFRGCRVIEVKVPGQNGVDNLEITLESPWSEGDIVRLTVKSIPPSIASSITPSNQLAQSVSSRYNVHIEVGQRIQEI